MPEEMQFKIMKEFIFRDFLHKFQRIFYFRVGLSSSEKKAAQT